MYNLVPRAFAQKPWVRCWSNNGIQSVHCASKRHVMRRDRLLCWTITCSCTWIRIWISKYSTLQSLFEFSKSCLKALDSARLTRFKLENIFPEVYTFLYFCFTQKTKYIKKVANCVNCNKIKLKQSTTLSNTVTSWVAISFHVAWKTW
jgi:hypothetical protein